LTPKPALELGELGIDALELGRFGDQNIHADVVANGHLIEQAAELRLHDRHPLGQAIALADELGIRPLGGRRVGRRGLGIPALGEPEVHGIETSPGRLF
jgi:hypothetical protein